MDDHQRSGNRFLILICVLLAGLNLARSQEDDAPTVGPFASPAPALPGAATASATPYQVAAQGAVVLDSFSGEFLWMKNPDQRLFPASTTKILTALLVIEAGHLDQPVTIELADTKVEPSSLGFKPGEIYTRRQLLYGLLLKSANDAALALARDNAGSVPAFAAKMNARAAELGAVNSHFVTPNGLHHPQHYTTSRDLALIARTAMRQPFFRQIVSTVDYPWNAATGPVPLRNHNRLLVRYPGCIGVKTGYTVPAQQVLVSSALRDGREFLAVVMHTNHPGIWVDSAWLLDLGFARTHF